MEKNAFFLKVNFLKSPKDQNFPSFLEDNIFNYL